MKIYLGLGSNIGDRKANISEAISLMDRALGSHHEAVSQIIETAPEGFVSDNDFLNCVVRYDTPMFEESPDEDCERLLGQCKSVERMLGRPAEVAMYDKNGARVYSDRTIDIDILFYGNATICEPELIVPHPRIAHRDFVMIPLMEVADKALLSSFPEIFESK